MLAALDFQRSAAARRLSHVVSQFLVVCLSTLSVGLHSLEEQRFQALQEVPI